MTPQELRDLSKRYNEHKGQIEEQIIRDLKARIPQVLICKNFGLKKHMISSRARKAKVHYYKKADSHEN